MLKIIVLGLIALGIAMYAAIVQSVRNHKKEAE